MSDLDQRLARGDVIILDGAVGTQLQGMGVPMHGVAWAAQALHTHPDTVRHMHEQYIRAGVDIITTNTYASARHNLEPLGLGDRVRELNLRGVVLAQEARDRTEGARSVYVAGAVSNFGILTDGEPRYADHRYSPGRSAVSGEQARANLREQAEILADAGVDVLLVESTGGMIHRRWVLEACLATGLPTWVGFKCRVESGDPTVRIGYASDTSLAEGLDLMRLGGTVVTVFHTSLDDTTSALAVVRDRWSGPVGAYPEASRSDYTAPQRDPSERTQISPEAFLERVRTWVDDGVQIVGGCCGIDVDYIRLLRDGLPRRIAGSRPGRLTTEG